MRCGPCDGLIDGELALGVGLGLVDQLDAVLLPSLLRATVAPACGLPVVRLMTVPVTAA